jgi:hypothetical protein
MRVPGGKYPAMPWRNGFHLTGKRCAQAADVTVIAARLQKLRNGQLRQGRRRDVGQQLQPFYRGPKPSRQNPF